MSIHVCILPLLFVNQTRDIGANLPRINSRYIEMVQISPYNEGSLEPSNSELSIARCSPFLYVYAQLYLGVSQKDHSNLR